ncbi:MAG: lysophospholipid acyltransferase family protein [Opitutaceae bacterium]
MDDIASADSLRPPETAFGAAPVPATSRRQPGWLRCVLMRYVIPECAFVLLTALRQTWRIRQTGQEHYARALASGQAPIFAAFHGRSFMTLNTISRRRGVRQFAMCSTSLDGDAMARLERRMGFDVIRGSSGQGGLQALVDMIRAVRAHPGSGAGLALDGSRGPRGHAQGGIIALAQRTGGIVIPVTVSATSAWVLRRTWDRTQIAKPFARVEVVFGEPLNVPPRLSAEGFERMRAELEHRMVALQAAADALSGHSDTEPVRALITR